MHLLFASTLGLGLPELIVIGVILIVLVLPLWLAPAILSFVLLGRIPAAHRKQEPGLAFLLLIPVFGWIWAFFVYPRISESLQAYFLARGDTSVGDCGRSLALAACICSVCSIIPWVGLGTGIAALVLLILFFVKTFELSGRIPKGS